MLPAFASHVQELPFNDMPFFCGFGQLTRSKERDGKMGARAPGKMASALSVLLSFVYLQVFFVSHMCYLVEEMFV